MSEAIESPIDEAVLLTDIEAGIAWLTLNRPAQYNALSAELLSALQAALDDIAGRDDVQVVIIKANGEAFCAGHDLKELRSSEDRAFHHRLFARCSRLMQSINTLPQPVIAMVQGIATAAGCQLVAACDLAVASTYARFAVSGINLGLFCATPAVPLSRTVQQKQAMRMLLTGDRIDAGSARNFGLISDVTAPESLEQTTRALAESILAKPPQAVHRGKAMFYKQLGMDLSAAYEYANEAMTSNMESPAAREGIDAFIEKRPPNWRDS